MVLLGNDIETFMSNDPANDPVIIRFLTINEQWPSSWAIYYLQKNIDEWSRSQLTGYYRPYQMRDNWYRTLCKWGTWRLHRRWENRKQWAFDILSSLIVKSNDLISFSFVIVHRVTISRASSGQTSRSRSHFHFHFYLIISTSMPSNKVNHSDS